MKIVQANDSEPYRAIIYGIEGVGKSTFGAMATRPIFISPETGVKRLRDRDGNKVQFFDEIQSFDAVLKAVKFLTTESHDFKTLVLDTTDWIENAAHRKIIGTSKKDIVRVNGGYGSGYRESQNLHQQLIDLLDQLISKREMNVIATAHYQVKLVKDPNMMEDYEQFELKGHEYVTSSWREWTEALLFARFNTIMRNNDEVTTQKARALTDDRRIVYCQKDPSFQAKNRFGLPKVMEFTPDFALTFEEYANAGAVDEKPEEIRSEIADLWAKLEDESTKELVSDSIEKAGNNVSDLNEIRKRLKEIVK